MESELKLLCSYSQNWVFPHNEYCSTPNHPSGPKMVVVPNPSDGVWKPPFCFLFGGISLDDVGLDSNLQAVGKVLARDQEEEMVITIVHGLIFTYVLTSESKDWCLRLRFRWNIPISFTIDHKWHHLQLTI